MPVGGAKIPVDRNCCLCKVRGKTLLVCLPRTSPQKYLLPYRDQRSSQDTLYRVLLAQITGPFFLLAFWYFSYKTRKCFLQGSETLAICNFAIRKQKGMQCKLQLAIAELQPWGNSHRHFVSHAKSLDFWRSGWLAVLKIAMRFIGLCFFLLGSSRKL